MIGSLDFRNLGILTQHYTAYNPEDLHFNYSKALWKPSPAACL